MMRNCEWTSLYVYTNVTNRRAIAYIANVNVNVNVSSRSQKNRSRLARVIYTVNHKKRDILFLTVTLAILTNFYSLYIILIAKKFYMRL